MVKKEDLTVQVLVSTMNQSDYLSLPNLLNLQTSAIIGNQCTKISPRENFVYEKFREKDILWLNFEEKGVGLNRNNALMRATADIVLFSDDDMTFIDGYEDIVLQLFKANPKADVIVFNLIEDIPKRHITKKAHFTKKCGYGCARIACRLESIMKYNIFFNLNYGGGACYSHGEDSLFLADCNRRGLKVLVVPEAIAHLNETRESTWFCGFTDKYFYDKGNLMAAMGIGYPRLRILYGVMKGHFSEKAIKAAKLIYKAFCEFKSNNRINVYKGRTKG